MIGYIITAIIATSLVAAYVIVVNCFLRQDEHYDEQ